MERMSALGTSAKLFAAATGLLLALSAAGPALATELGELGPQPGTEAAATAAGQGSAPEAEPGAEPDPAAGADADPGAAGSDPEPQPAPEPAEGAETPEIEPAAPQPAPAPLPDGEAGAGRDDDSVGEPEPLQFAASSTAVAQAATPKSGTHRLSGADRYATAVRVSAFSYPNGADTVVLVSGQDYPDAVSAAPLAAKLRAPLLLTPTGSIAAATLNEIKRLDPSRVIVVGGTGVVSNRVLTQLGSYGGDKVTRLGGGNRYETSAKVARFGWKAAGSTHAFVATGGGYADALAAAPAAAKLDAPVILAPNERGAYLNAATKALGDLKATKLHIAGGTGVISKNVQQALAEGGRSVQRYAGGDRYGTAAAILKGHFSGKIPGLFWASGQNFPDALAGAAAAGATGSALALSIPRCVPPVIGAETKKISSSSTVLLGGRWVLTDFVRDGLSCAKADNIDSPSSITVVVNKQRPLSPRGFAPGDLRRPNIANSGGQLLRSEAATALERMTGAAVSAGINVTLLSGYRSYDTQASIYQRYISQDGQALADTYSARPGYSEHQTGLAADLSDGGGCGLGDCFAHTAAGKWLKANAYRFGYILRYDAGLQPIVGYTFEPWHFRYVGVKVSRDMHDKGIPTLEEYYGLAPAPRY